MDACAHIIVAGNVQGVGYRFFVLKTARRMQLNGWVKNLYTGEVEILAEGSKGLIESMIKELWTGNTWATVRNVEVHWEPYKGQYDGFDITY
jgi:acylphosphatase